MHSLAVDAMHVTLQRSCRKFKLPRVDTMLRLIHARQESPGKQDDPGRYGMCMFQANALHDTIIPEVKVNGTDGIRC